jgi:general nucleoside transport system ATP-binding protein
MDMNARALGATRTERVPGLCVPGRSAGPAPREGGAPLVRVEGVTKTFGPVLANDGISLELRSGEIHAIVGENGAGKTTLINILFGIVQPDEGTIFVDGQPVTIRSPHDAIRMGFGLVSQHFLLVERHTVAENLALALPGLGFRFSPARIERELEPLARQYGLALDLHAPVSRLSPGQRQRVEIAKALLLRSRVVILDEPTSVLTPREAAELFQVLRHLRSAGCGIIFISHKLDDVLAVSDRLSVLRRGRLVLEAPTRGVDKEAVSFAMVGRDVAAARRELAPAAGGGVALRVEGLRLGREGPPLSFSVNRGEILGFAGVAGNGQAELAELMTGLARMRSGVVELNGRQLAGLGAAQFRRAGVAHIPEDRNRMGVVPSMTIEENFTLRWLDSPECHRGPLLLRGTMRRNAAGLMGEYRMSADSPRLRTSLLSGGNVQRLILARELVGSPELVVAVHPTYGLDVQAIAQVHQALLDQAARGAAILLISEDLDELLALADRIAVLYDRRIIGCTERAVAQLEQLGMWMAGQAQ